MIQSERSSIRILTSGRDALNSSLAGLGVDPYGIRIMLPKGTLHRILLGPVPFPAANILKQEMLSLGGDCALPREAVTGRLKQCRCLLLGSSAQIARLTVKLNRQPFGLAPLARDISRALANYEKPETRFAIKGKTLSCDRSPLIMGILNLTTDSFSGDGLLDRGAIREYAAKLAADGADILDIGGESSRPGARPVGLKEELRRVIPVVKELAGKTRIPVSVDTVNHEVARRALDAGAAIVNDISGLRDPAMARICAKAGCGVIIMHMRGTPRTMKKLNRYDCLMEELARYFRAAVAAAREAGIREERIAIDPGIGFAKDPGQNLEILRNLRELTATGRPILVGTSRKSFIGGILGTPPEDRLAGTIASCVIAQANGAAILRVHDVKEIARAVKTAAAIIHA